MNSYDAEMLLVEDNPNDVELTLHAFEKNNLAHKWHVVRDGAEALEYLFGTGANEQHHPEVFPRLILLDLKLPKVDGLEVLRRVKGDPRTRTIPVITITTSREDRDIMETYNLGGNSYVVKPVDFEQFSEVIRQLGLYWLLLNHPSVLTRGGRGA